MPRYFFDTTDGARDVDPDGTELRNIEEAKDQAAKHLAEILRHHADKVWETGKFQVSVRDEDHLSLFTLQIVAIPSAAILPAKILSRSF